jgi:hypothetical protein
MPLSFDKYRFTDGVTALSAGTFNPRFQDLDTRIAALEALNIAWQAAVQTLTDFGLARLDSVLSPTFATLNQDVANANASVAAITQSQAAALAAVAAWQASTLAAITAWENALQSTALAVLDTTAILAGNGQGGFASVAIGAGLNYANGTLNTAAIPALSSAALLAGDGKGGFTSATVGSGLSYSNGTLSAPTLTWSAKNASFAAAFQNGYYVIAAGVVATLPVGTADGQQVLFINGLSGASTFTIVPSSGQKVMGDSNGLTVDITYGGFALIYFAATSDWRVF